MLKRFFLNILSSFVGAWIALALFLLSAFLLVLGLMGNLSLSTGKSTEQLKSKSVLLINLDGPIEEREMATEPDIYTVLSGNLSSPQTLDVIVQSIKEAAVNKNIVAVYLKCGSLAAAPATLDAIRHALLEFKDKTDGKKLILAYGDSYTQGAYFVASVADCIYLNPDGNVELKGLSSSNFYLKGLLDKLGVQFQVVKVGTFKSAVEPYIMSEMSEPARAQLDTLFGNMWKYIRENIAASRKKITPSGIDSLINKGFIAIAPSEEASKAGLVDSLAFERIFLKRLADISDRKVEDLNFVSPSTLASQTPWANFYKAKNQIAVLFACGEIVDGNSNAINFEDLCPIIVSLADDDNVKGLVLRVNSPGGSAFGSDQIGEALDYFRSKGKPLAVSMGDYAASGGYWISAGADRIFADPLTITGSIGIFGLIPNFKGTLDKIGVNVASVSTNPSANFPTGFAPLDETQLSEMQKFVERGYEQFIERVAKGRKLKEAEVRKIAEGRVWDAQTALKIGLIDAMGYLQDAIDWTATKAGVYDKFDVAAYPLIEPTIWNMIQMQSMAMTLGDFKTALEKGEEKLIQTYIIKKFYEKHPVQARMPEMKVIL